MTPSTQGALALAARINQLLIAPAGGKSPLTIATAESCTGGGVAAALTSLAGSSDYMMGGIVSYSNAAKANLLGVSQEILATRGAVSPECARAMAEGARRALGSDLAVSTTGIAGPGGGTARKPVGLVYIALADTEGASAIELHLAGDRAAVTSAAVEAALAMLLERIQREVSPR
ncbi:MAG: nicotinamide-nucleotide amidohydrolase family protein [Thermomicrobiales bacterium]|nr:nicotinamide-nucleotide amidohydrolase family protein [Thermomicrobiales bacterium]MCA9879082.1 nicotinamide-nucleotide amidohydrolase family protein [Thermomicrobiales bacterium]